MESFTSFLNTVFSESSVNMTLKHGLIPVLRVYISEVGLLHVGMESERCARIVARDSDFRESERGDGGLC